MYSGHQCIQCYLDSRSLLVFHAMAILKTKFLTLTTPVSDIIRKRTCFTHTRSRLRKDAQKCKKHVITLSMHRPDAQLARYWSTHKALVWPHPSFSLQYLYFRHVLQRHNLGAFCGLLPFVIEVKFHFSTCCILQFSLHSTIIQPLPIGTRLFYF